MERSKLIAALVRKGIAAAIRKNGTDADLAPALLPALRAAAAADPKIDGSDPSLFYGTVDPVYYREIGLARPILRADGSPLAGKDGKIPANVLRASVARRRNAGGRLGRWNVLAASTEAAVGRKIGPAEIRDLAAKGGVDLAASYVGRGTRDGAPATRVDPAAAVETA